MIDAHHHLWDPRRIDYPWLGPELAPIDGPMEFATLEPLLEAAGISQTVVVQAVDSDADTDYLLEVAAAHPTVAAVVGWVPLAFPETAAARLDELERHAAFRGVRTTINLEPDPDWLLRPDVDDGLALLERRGLPFDVVSVRRRHLEIIPIVSERHPGLAMVIDHLSKPPIKKDQEWIDGWKRNLARAAENPNVFAKISGLFPARGELDDWTAEDVRPFFEFALDAFGSSRLMYGSDWPISELAGGYLNAWHELNVLFDELTPQERDDIVGGTAARFYRIDAPDAASGPSARREAPVR